MELGILDPPSSLVCIEVTFDAFISFVFRFEVCRMLRIMRAFDFDYFCDTGGT